MGKFRIDFFGKSLIAPRSTVFSHSQYAGGVKLRTLCSENIPNDYFVTRPDSDYDYESEHGMIKIHKFDKKQGRYL
jgi:hypothetical protein